MKPRQQHKGVHSNLKEQIMKHIKLAVISVLVFAANGAYAQYPADAEASYSMAGTAQSEAWGVGKRAVPTPHNAFPFGGGQIDD
jgi:hypothetical protein